MNIEIKGCDKVKATLEQGIEDSKILSSAIQKLVDDITNSERNRYERKLKEAIEETAQECYLECLAVGCGETEFSGAIKSKFKL